MDSCHIFNFLFGTRKTASDLRRCFTNAAAGGNGENRAQRRNKPARPGEREMSSPPASPLKQIHSKLLNFATNSAATVTKLTTNTSGGGGQAHNLDHASRSTTIATTTTISAWPHQSGTYKATLIELPLVEEEELEVDENNNCLVTSGMISGAVVNLVDNPSAERDLESPIEEQQQQDKPTHLTKRVRHLVQSFESNDLSDNASSQAVANSTTQGGGPMRLRWPPTGAAMGPEAEAEKEAPDQQQQADEMRKPITIVKPMPPKTPPKSNRVKCLNLQLLLNKPNKLEHLFQDDTFLARHFFAQLRPLDRCSAAQVCRKWRNILYSNPAYWKELVGVIDCTQLRREHLIECIVNTLHTAKLKHQLASAANNSNINYQPQQHHNTINSSFNQYHSRWSQLSGGSGDENGLLEALDQDEIWRIQELCNRYARGSLAASQHHQARQCANSNNPANQQQVNTTTYNGEQLASSKSQSSIPSPISSTLSSVSISSLLSPLSESSRVDSIREKLYTALDERGFDALCLFGATDDDIEELVCKTRPQGAQQRVLVGRLNNCSLTDKGLEQFLSHFNQIEELELTGCNELTNALELKPLCGSLKRLIITDCINIADGLAQRLATVFNQLEELCIQAYHLTDAFLEYLSLNNDTSRLRRLELFQCKEITNSSMLTIAKHFQAVEALSISGSSRITDDGVEILTEHSKHLRSLDLSWCTKITDVSLECLACDLGPTLQELILDRNIHITDCGLGYLATMGRLEALYIRWCPRITDLGLEALLTMRSLRRLSLAGLQQLTARSLLALATTKTTTTNTNSITTTTTDCNNNNNNPNLNTNNVAQLDEIELTNCPAVNSDLLQFLRTKLPKCNIIY